MFLVGDGKVQACKYFDKMTILPLCQIPQGVLIGDVPFFFERNATYAVETVSYCSIGVIKSYDFN